MPIQHNDKALKFAKEQLGINIQTQQASEYENLLDAIKQYQIDRQQLEEALTFEHLKQFKKALEALMEATDQYPSSLLEKGYRLQALSEEPEEMRSSKIVYLYPSSNDRLAVRIQDGEPQLINTDAHKNSQLEPIHTAVKKQQELTTSQKVLIFSSLGKTPDTKKLHYFTEQWLRLARLARLNTYKTQIDELRSYSSDPETFDVTLGQRLQVNPDAEKPIKLNPRRGLIPWVANKLQHWFGWTDALKDLESKWSVALEKGAQYRKHAKQSSQDTAKKQRQQAQSSLQNLESALNKYQPSWLDRLFRSRQSTYRALKNSLQGLKRQQTDSDATLLTRWYQEQMANMEKERQPKPMPFFIKSLQEKFINTASKTSHPNLNQTLLKMLTNYRKMRESLQSGLQMWLKGSAKKSIYKDNLDRNDLYQYASKDVGFTDNSEALNLVKEVLFKPSRIDSDEIILSDLAAFCKSSDFKPLRVANLLDEFFKASGLETPLHESIDMDIADWLSQFKRLDTINHETPFKTIEATFLEAKEQCNSNRPIMYALLVYKARELLLNAKSHVSKQTICKIAQSFQDNLQDKDSFPDLSKALKLQCDAVRQEEQNETVKQTIQLTAEIDKGINTINNNVEKNKKDRKEIKEGLVELNEMLRSKEGEIPETNPIKPGNK